jgi:hypothetical protein
MKTASLLLMLFISVSLLSAETGVISGSGATGEKPQSKAWFAQGKWWCCLGGKIFKKNGSGFSQIQTVTTSTSLLADAKWDGSHLMLLLAGMDASSAKFYKFTYNSSSDNYTPVSGFPVDLSLGGGAETITFDVDGSGQIFASFETGGKIKVIWTTSADHKSWNTTGTTIGSGTSSDDISATAAMSGGQIGVLWSNQSDRKFHFRMHLPGAPETQWTADEIANTGYSSDDHISLAVTPDGRIYAAVKTSGGGSTHLLLERKVSGTWNTYPVAPTGGTRPGLMYSREKDEILFYYNTAEGTSPVVLYQVPCGAIVLNSPTTIISNSDARNVTGTKQILDAQSGCLILAQKGRSGVSSAYFYYQDLEPGKTITALSITPAAASIEEMLTQQFTAMATYDDGSSLNVSHYVAWTSEKTSVASVNASGLATAISSGTTDIIANYNGFSDSAGLTVTPSSASLDSLVIENHAGIVVVGNTATLTATGYYSNGKVVDKTPACLWSSSNSGLAQVTAGVVTGLNTGNTVISAELDGKSDSTMLSIVNQPDFVKKINFQTTGTVTPAGYEADVGEVYSAARGFGWSASPSEKRERNLHPDKRYDTFCKDYDPLEWSLDLPSPGNYKITAVMGDTGYSTSNTLTCNGQSLISAPSSNSFSHATDTLTLSASKLTISVKGAICFLEIVSVETSGTVSSDFPESLSLWNNYYPG